LHQCRAGTSGIFLAASPFNDQEIIMMDAIMLAIGFVFFALSIAYVYACDRL
jgi:hypothetical protein